MEIDLTIYVLSEYLHTLAIITICKFHVSFNQ